MSMKKEMREENRTFVRLFEAGKDKEVWLSLAQCAERISVPAGTLSGYLHGYTHGETVLEAVREMQAAIDAAPAPQQGGHPLLDLFKEGKTRELWFGYTDCGAALKVHDSTISRYLELEKRKRIKTVRMKRQYAELLRRMRNKLGKPQPVTTSDEQEPTHSTTGPPLDREDPHGVIASPHYDRLLAGVAELRDQNLDGVRFVLTKRNFRRIKGVVTKEEIGDTKLLIEELRRRLNLLTQNDDEEIRAKCYQALGRELDELFLVCRLIQEVVPTAAAEEIDRLRQKFSEFHKTHTAKD